MANTFVTNYGHAENNGASFASPKRTTINEAANTIIYLNGYLNENIGKFIFFGTNNSVLDMRPAFTMLSAGIVSRDIYYISNLTLTSDGGVSPGQLNLTANCPTVTVIASQFSLFYNITSFTGAIYNKNTLIGKGVSSSIPSLACTNTITPDSIISNFGGGITVNGITNALTIKYILFSKSSFKFIGGVSNETTFTYPTGATDQLKLDNLKTRMATVYGGAPDDYLVGCKYTDDADTTIFIDPARNNYYLVPNSLPTKMSYDGKYIGARPEGSFIAFNSSNFTYTNFDANGNIVDQRIDATATSSIVDMLQIRTINKLDSLGQLAARNGNELNLNETILPNPLIYTDALTLNRTYKVYNAAITVGAPTYQIGDCFIAKGTSFISGADTYNPTGIAAGTLLVDLGCYEVENNSVTYMGVTYTTGQRFQCYYDSSSTFTGTGTVKRFMGGFVRLLSEYYGTTGITAGTTLRYMQTYEVVGGTSVTYNSVVYTPGQRFTALNSPTTFTRAGGATISEWNIGYPKSLEMKASKTDSALSTDVWVKMHLTDTPLVNVDGNGKITHGNLDSGFNRATAVAMSVRYWQCRLTVQSLNIPY